MSLEIVRREVERFLASEKPEALCLTGTWGVGKSYAWNMYLKLAKAQNAIALKRYAYVSLFGINSMTQLKLAIVEASIPTNMIGEKRNLGAARADPSGMARAHWAKIASKLPALLGWKDSDEFLQQLLFRNVHNQVVCLDDLERKGDGLKIKDVFGLASFLEEQRGCKVVFILNDGAFDNEEEKDLKEYFEKTIDSHVQFSPSAAECAAIALPSSSNLHMEMRKHCIALGISNIRVIRRLERLAAMLHPLLAQYNEQVFIDFLRCLVLFGWAKFGADGPSLEFIRSFRSLSYLRTNEPSNEERKWSGALSAYGYTYFSPTAEIVAEAIDRGFFEEEKLRSEAKKLHEGYVARKSEAKFHDAWGKFHNSFEDNEGDFINDLSMSFRESIEYISPGNASSTVSVLKELGHGILAKELLDLYVSSRSAETFDSRNHFSVRDVTDPDFAEAVRRKLTAMVDERNPADVLIGISQRRGWNPEDLTLLAKVDADGFHEIFKGIADGDQLDAAIRMALDFGNLVGGAGAGKIIGDNARAGLLKIASESRLNRLRVAKYGVGAEKGEVEGGDA